MIRKAMNKAFRYRLMGSGLPVILGLFLLGIWYIAITIGVRNPSLNRMMLLMPYVALFLIVFGPIILIIRAVFLRIFSGSITNNPARVARRFYSEVLADNFPDWGTAFALIHPSARCAISPPTPDGLKNYWTQTRKACQTASATVCSLPFTCYECGRTLAVFESMVLHMPSGHQANP
jgi:hypothetical protein